MKFSIERQIPLAFAVAVLLLIVLGVLAYRNLTALNNAVEWEVHTRQVLQKLDETLIHLVDAETSTRGFALTGDESYLENFDQSGQTIQNNLTELQTLISDNPQQIERLQNIERLSRNKLEILTSYIDLRRKMSRDEALKYTGTGEGKNIMNKIRAIFEQMKSQETALLHEREDNQNKNFSQAVYLSIIGSAVGIFILLLANLVIVRQIKLRSDAEDALKTSHKELETRVESRTKELAETNQNLQTQIEKRLEAESRQKFAIEAGQLGIWRLNPQTNIYEADERTLELSGIAAQEFDGSGKSLFQNLHSEDLPVVRKALETALSNDSEYFAEFRINGENNSTRWIQAVARPQKNGGVTYLTGFSSDITAQKENEIALRQSDLFNRTTLDSLSSNIAVIDKNGLIIKVNKAWNEFAGQNKAADSNADPCYLGINYLDVCRTGEQDENTKMIADNLRKILDNRKESFSFEYPCHSPTEKRWFLLNITALQTVEGGAVISHTNITDRIIAETERERLFELEKQARLDAEAANRLRDEFLATVSHELRNPLNAILGWSRMLQKTQLDENAYAKAVDAVVRNAEAQNRLIEDLLDVSRIIAGKLRLDIAPLNPSDFVEAAVETVRPAAEAKEIGIVVEIKPDVNKINGDANRLQQVVWNLLSNAIKFTPKKGEVAVAAACVDSMIEITVTDNGIGIKKDFLPNVFERFRQADASTIRKFGGLGLGLAIVRHIVEMHGGTVQVESKGENQGSTFIVKLPVAAVSVEAEQISKISEAVFDANRVSPAYDLSGLSILAVDDEPDICQLLKQALDHCGAEVQIADSSAAALKLFENNRFDLIISDIGMPDEDGYSFIQKIRNLPNGRGKKIPAVALTAFARPLDRVKALEAGFQIHISKPAEPDELITIIASLSNRLIHNQNDRHLATQENGQIKFDV